MHTKVEWDWNNLKIALVNLIRRLRVIVIVWRFVPIDLIVVITPVPLSF